MAAVAETSRSIQEFHKPTAADKARIEEILKRTGYQSALAGTLINWGGKEHSVQVGQNSFKIQMMLDGRFAPVAVEVYLGINNLFEAGTLEIGSTGFSWGTEGNPPRVMSDGYFEKISVEYDEMELTSMRIAHLCLQINHNGSRYLFLENGELLQLAR